MSKRDLELSNRFRQAKKVAIVNAIVLLFCGVGFLFLGYWTDNPEQKEFNRRMTSGGIASSGVVRAVPSLSAGAALSTLLMSNAHLLFYGFGLFGLGYSVVKFFNPLSDTDRNKITKDYLAEGYIAQKKEERDRALAAKSSIDSGSDVFGNSGKLEFKGVYCEAIPKAKDKSAMHLRFLGNGKVAGLFARETGVWSALCLAGSDEQAANAARARKSSHGGFVISYETDETNISIGRLVNGKPQFIGKILPFHLLLSEFNKSGEKIRELELEFWDLPPGEDVSSARS